MQAEVVVARVELPVEWVTDDPDQLPQVCVLSGARADGTIWFTLAYTPRWTWVLILFGVLPFLVASWFAAERVRVRLPVSRSAVNRLRTQRRAGVGLVGLGLLVEVVAAALGGDDVLLVLGVVVVLLGVVAFLFGAIRRPSGKRIDHQWITVWGVHERFADAISRTKSALVG